MLLLSNNRNLGALSGNVWPSIRSQGTVTLHWARFMGLGGAPESQNVRCQLVQLEGFPAVC